MPTIASYLLHVVTERGEVRNLLALSNELGLHWTGAHRAMKYLEREGLVTVQRGGLGHPCVIKPCSEGREKPQR